MTHIEIKPSTAEKLEHLVQKTEKTLDEVLDLLLSQYSQTILVEQTSPSDDDTTWTDDDIEQLIQPDTPLTGKEMVERGFVGGWQHKQIDDSVVFLQQQRSNRKKNKFL